MSTSQTVASKVIERRIKNRQLPTIGVPQTGQPELDRSLKDIAEHLRMYEGGSGAARQRFITIEDLEQAGLVSITEKQGYAAITKVLGSNTPQSVTADPTRSVVLAIDSQNINNLDGIGNVSTGAKKTGDFLYWDGTAWLPLSLYNTQNTWKARQLFQEGVIEFQERAAAPSAQEGRGYIWLKADAPNILNFTDDAGTTVQLGAGLTSVAVSDLDNGTDGELITWDAAGAPTTVAVGTAAQVLTSNGAGAAPTFQAAASGAGVLKFKTADEAVSSSTTVQDDDHLFGWSLTADTWYRVEAFFVVHSSTAGDWKNQFTFTNTPSDTGGNHYIGNTFSGAYAVEAGAFDQIKTWLWGSTTDYFIQMLGMFKSHATTGGTMKLQWAQGTSTGTAATVRAGTWMIVTEMP